MRKRDILLAAALLFVGGSGAQATGMSKRSPPFRLCVLDRSAILRQSRVALAMAVQFQQIRQQAQAEFEREQRSLDDDTRALESLGASLAPAVLANRRDMLAQRRLQQITRGEQINRNLSRLDAELTNNIARISAPTVRVIEVERACSMLIARDALLSLNDMSLDITAAVVDRMNNASAPPQPR